MFPRIMENGQIWGQKKKKKKAGREKRKKRERKKKKIKNEIMKFKTMNLHEDITQNNMLQNKNVNTDKTEKMLVKILYTVNRERSI